MAGNSVVSKPSEVTPLANMLIGQAWEEIGGPKDVYLVATGTGATGAALVDEVDMIMFTGSTATGKKIMARAAETLTPVSLELGGKDPMIVLRDADLERAANVAVQYSMMNAGQVCQSVERVYVEEPVYDEFVSKVVEKTRRPAPGRSRRGRLGRRRRRDPPAAVGHRGAPRERRREQGRQGAGGRPPQGRCRPLLRADRDGRRGPHDGGDDRGDLRPDDADHEGARRGGGHPAGQRLARTASTPASSPRTSRRASGSPSGSRRGTPA